MYKIIFSKDALADIKEAKEWYNQQQKGLGKRLVADVKTVVNDIKLNPFYASIKYQNIRTASCKTFPYAVHYELNESLKLIYIVAIFHFSRKPFWLE
jgi:plasmid stabilization system protein ParE